MAINPIQYGGMVAPQTLDFTPLAQLGQVYQQGQAQRAKQQALSQLGQGGQADINALIQSGDMSLANLGLQLQQRQQSETRDARDFAFRQEEAKRAQANADRSFGLQQRAANRADEDKPVFKEVTNADGSTSLYRLMPRDPNAKATRVDIGPQGGGPVEQANPFAGSGKLTEQQSKDRLFAGRLFGAEQNLRKFEMQGTDRWQNALNTAGGKIGWNLNNKDYQQFDQAKRDYLNAVLRKESGAVISPQEFDNGDKQYFPQPGDSKEVIAQKRRNRAEAIKGIAAGAGQSWRVPFTFDDAGNLQPRAASVPVQQTQGITQEQFNALPSGSVFTAPDGTQRVKP